MNPRKEKDNSLLFCVAEDSEHSKKCRSFSLGPLGLLSCNLRVSFSRLGLNMVCVFWGGHCRVCLFASIWQALFFYISLVADCTGAG